MIQGETPMKRKATRTRDGIDWLAVAIARMGGPKGAARKLNVPQSVIIGWLDRGLADASFGTVEKPGALGQPGLPRIAGGPPRPVEVQRKGNGLRARSPIRRRPPLLDALENGATW